MCTWMPEQARQSSKLAATASAQQAARKYGGRRLRSHGCAASGFAATNTAHARLGARKAAKVLPRWVGGGKLRWWRQAMALHNTLGAAMMLHDVPEHENLP